MEMSCNGLQFLSDLFPWVLYADGEEYGSYCPANLASFTYDTGSTGRPTAVTDVHWC